MIRKWLRWLLDLFRLPPAPVPPPVPLPPPEPRKERQPRHQGEHFGVHYYLGDLLDRMDTYFAALKALKKEDREGWRMISRWGCTVTNKGSKAYTELEPYFIKTMPAFGAFHVGYLDDPKYWRTEFIYFSKQKNPINVQPTNGTCYRVGFVYFDTIKNKMLPVCMYVSLSEDGTIKALKECAPRYHKLGHWRRDARDGWSTTKIVRMEWGHSSILEGWLEDWGKKEGITTPDDLARATFGMIVNFISQNECGIAVRARKDNQVAAFSIDMLRTPYFFSDRDKIVNVNGRTLRIFHIVRPHVRKNGTAIKAHFRGIRRFTWNGYDVSIGLPGRHYRPLSSLTTAGHEAIDLPDGIAFGEVAAMVDKHITAAQGAHGG